MVPPPPPPPTPPPPPPASPAQAPGPRTVKTMSSRASTPTPTPTPTPADPHPPPPLPPQSVVQQLSRLRNRHCVYYAAEGAPGPAFTSEVSITAAAAGSDRAAYEPEWRSTTNVHLGQRKLMLSEVQFLTAYFASHPGSASPTAPRPVLVYVGSAPGTHLTVLSRMFPRVFFVLYDGARFDTRLRQHPDAFEIHEGEQDGFMTTAKCVQISERFARLNAPLLFVSDIRLGEDDRDKFEEGVKRDMELQMEWIRLLSPEMSLVKFRLPYSLKHGDAFQYMPGRLLYQIWPKGQSGETRLIIDGKDVRKDTAYDFQAYEESMFFHNRYRRPFCYHDLAKRYSQYIYDAKDGDNAYCPCYDCLSELAALEEYARVARRPFHVAVEEFGRGMNPQRRVAFMRPHHGHGHGPGKGSRGSAAPPLPLLPWDFVQRQPAPAPAPTQPPNDKPKPKPKAAVIAKEEAGHEVERTPAPAATTPRRAKVAPEPKAHPPTKPKKAKKRK